MVSLLCILQVLRQSRLYESAPAYVTDQPVFLNAALAVRTALSPRQLLTALKDVEVRHRQPHIYLGASRPGTWHVAMHMAYDHAPRQSWGLQ